MELYRVNIENRPPECRDNGADLGFDPDKLIEPSSVNPESLLSDYSYVTGEFEGLKETEQKTKVLENGNRVYDEPEETGKILNNEQGKAVPEFQGDCGLVACENVARLAGKHVTEADVIKLALENGFCSCDSENPAENGNTAVLDLCGVLEYLDFDTSLLSYDSIDKVADAVESGRGVIAVVNVSEFWDDFPYEGSHAVVVTSVERTPDGEPVAFYVCDSGSMEDDSSRRIDVDRLDRSLTGGSLVTTYEPIR